MATHHRPVRCHDEVVLLPLYSDPARLTSNYFTAYDQRNGPRSLPYRPFQAYRYDGAWLEIAVTF